MSLSPSLRKYSLRSGRANVYNINVHAQLHQWIPNQSWSAKLYTFQRLLHMILSMSKSGAHVLHHPTERGQTLIMAYKWSLNGGKLKLA